MVVSSYMGVYLDAAMENCLCHFDYERGKAHGYPEAHFQLHAVSDSWEQALTVKEVDGSARTRPLSKLHFPVGGRRYRPTLEDVVEFLIIEGMVEEPKGNWKELLTARRAVFQEKQLRAAIRANPEIARQALIEVDSAI